jgi:hypothetical protein
MREIRQSGSEGGAVQTNAPFLPLSGDTFIGEPESKAKVLQGFLDPGSPLEACGDKLRRGNGFVEFSKRLS